MARRDGDCFLCRRATFYWHNSGANSLQKCMRIFRKFWHTILNISRLCGQILMKSCPAGAKTMQIVILKARGLGKFCSSRTRGIKVGKIDKIFTKVPSGERYLNFLGPAGGSRTRKGAFAFSRQYHMARRDGDCFLCRRATFYWHNSGANSLQKCMRIFRKFWHKILNISRPCGQILMKSCPAGAKTM